MGTGGIRNELGTAIPPYNKNKDYVLGGNYTFTGGLRAPVGAGTAYYVDRNATGNGNGLSWGNAYTTITEAINAVNSDYSSATAPSGGRNRTIYIGEGYYGEVPVSLTCNDCTIIVVAPGTHDSTVFYGSATAGGFDATTTAPAITITGSNNTIYGLGVVNRSAGLQPAILIDDGAISNKIINCKITKDAADSSIYGIVDLGNAYTEIIGCEFTVSCKTAGIRLYSATNNSIQIKIQDCVFMGMPTGVLIDAAAHMARILDCMFMDDTSDVADTMDTPILNNSGQDITIGRCVSRLSTANLVTGNGNSLQFDLFTFTEENA